MNVLALITSLLIFSGSMNLEPTIQAMVKRQAVAWETGDVSSIVKDFAPNAIFIASGDTFQGVEAIKKAADAYFRQFTDTKVTIKRIIIDDDQGAVEWDWSDRQKKTGQQSEAEDAIIFEVRDDGKISYWREYIEKKSKS
jgi:uncharacterized protein (TIGR02246 family)